MGWTYTSVTVRNLVNRARSAIVYNVLVDPAVDGTWIDRKTLERITLGPVPGKDRTFTMADGRLVTRQIGYAMLQADPHFQTVDEVVFAEPEDMQRPGARTLAGFNAVVDAAGKRLVPSGPQLVPGNYHPNPEN